MRRWGIELEKSVAYKYILPSIKNRSLSIKPKDYEYNFRIEKAKQQRKFLLVDRKDIIKYVRDYLESFGMKM